VSVKHTEEYYFSYWRIAREQLLAAAALDPPMNDKPDMYRFPSRIIFGASTHNYRCEPMLELDIQSFEAQFGITLPINFRTFLLVCGFNSGGPGYGIRKERIINGEAVGDVFSCTGDMLFYEGSFESWYEKWLAEIFRELDAKKL